MSYFLSYHPLQAQLFQQFFDSGAELKESLNHALSLLRDERDEGNRILVLTFLQENAIQIFENNIHTLYIFIDQIITIYLSKYYKSSSTSTSSILAGDSENTATADEYNFVFLGQILVCLTTLLLSFDVLHKNDVMFQNYVQMLLEIMSTSSPLQSAAAASSSATNASATPVPAAAAKSKTTKKTNAAPVVPVVIGDNCILKQMAAESLHELELAYEGLMQHYVFWLLRLCQRENSCALQSYTTLLLTVLKNWVSCKAKNPQPSMMDSLSASSGSMLGSSYSARMMQQQPSLYTSTNNRSNLSSSVSSASYMSSSFSGVGHQQQTSIFLTTAFAIPPHLLDNFHSPSALSTISSESSRGAPPMTSFQLPPENVKELQQCLSFIIENTPLFTIYGKSDILENLFMLVPACDFPLHVVRGCFYKPFYYGLSPLTLHMFLRMRKNFAKMFDISEDEQLFERLLQSIQDFSIPPYIRIIVLNLITHIAKLFQPSSPSYSYAKELFNRRHREFYPSPFDEFSAKYARLTCLTECFHEDQPIKDSLLDDIFAYFQDYKYYFVKDEAIETLQMYKENKRVRILFDFMLRLLRTNSRYYDKVYEWILELLKTEKNSLLDYIIDFLNQLRFEFLVNAPNNQQQQMVDFGGAFLRSLEQVMLSERQIKDEDFMHYFPLLHRLMMESSIHPVPLLLRLEGFVKKSYQQGDWFIGNNILNTVRTAMMTFPTSQIFTAACNILLLCSNYYNNVDIRDRASMYYQLITHLHDEKLMHILTEFSPATTSSSMFVMSTLHQYGSSSDALLKQMKQLHIIDSKLFELIRIPYQRQFPPSQQRSSIVESPVPAESSLQDPQVQQQIVAAYTSNLRKLSVQEQSIELLCNLQFSENNSPVESSNDDQDQDSIIIIRKKPAVQNIKYDKIFALTVQFVGPQHFKKLKSIKIPYLAKQDAEAKAPERAALAEAAAEEDLQEKTFETSPSGTASSTEATPVAKPSKAPEPIKYQCVLQISPLKPVPASFDCTAKFTAQNGMLCSTKLNPITISFQDLFLPIPLPRELLSKYGKSKASQLEMLRVIFDKTWSTSTASPKWTQSVKVLQGVSAAALRELLTTKLLPFGVSVSMEKQLEKLITPLQEETQKQGSEGSEATSSSTAASHLDFMIFMPPKYHLLLRFQVTTLPPSSTTTAATNDNDDDIHSPESNTTAATSSSSSTPEQSTTTRAPPSPLCNATVHVRTDYWQILTFIDQFLQV